MEQLTVEFLEKKYMRIPLEMKQTRRWICYNIMEKDGRETKVPINPINGGFARSNDSTTWSTFRVAILGCVKYNMVGIGFMLGTDTTSNTSYFGIDLDNHADPITNKKPLNEDEFDDFSSEFVNALNSYTEYSHSGEGVHIICKGTLPEGARRKNGVGVEMYDKGRFFTMTGNVINNVPISDRTSEIKPLWEKYLKPVEVEDDYNVPDNFNGIVFGRKQRNVFEFASSALSDSELIEKIKNSQGGLEFIDLYNGNMSAYSNDHSAADMAMCKQLAFWTGCDLAQMDRIFRSSGLMRKKWDEMRGSDTYGNITLHRAIQGQHDVYTPPKEKIIIDTRPTQPTITIENKQQPIEAQGDIVQFDDKGDPIIVVKKIFKAYTLTDTGNAERFYDYFGENFRYNNDNQKFMFWNGKTWLKDNRSYVRKYADKIIDVLKSEITNTRNKLEETRKQGDEAKDEIKELEGFLKGQQDNLKRVSNKAGKDAMISELEHLHDIPVLNSEFDTQENLLNTDSGVVNLETGEIMPFDKNLKLSKNTNCKVSFEEPTVWLKFLHDLFERPNKDETEEIIDCVQMGLGLSLTGRTNKDQLFILYGNGSNGKSTFIEMVRKVFGDYGMSMNSDLLIQNNSSSQSNEFSISALLGARLVSTSETAEGKKLDEIMIKKMTSGEQMNAQFKYGQPFIFSPTFSPWMSTNNKPIIRATDFGTWRRIFFIPFLNTFTGEKKDVNMPKKLAAEMPQILGWMIQGNVRLVKNYKGILPKPKCLEVALVDYKKEMDVIANFISARCVDFPKYETNATILYQTYKEWCKDNTEYLMSETKFKLELPKRGYKLVKDNNKGWVYIGLKLESDRKGIVFGSNNEKK